MRTWSKGNHRNVEVLPKLTKSELCYLAGLIDGRGSVRMQRSGYRRKDGTKNQYPMIRMCVTEGRWGLIRKLRNNLGGCMSNCDPEGYRMFWQLSGRNAVQLLAKVQPHIKSQKRKQEIKDLLREVEA